MKTAKKILDSYPKDIREKIKQLRELIFEIAKKDERIGPITESVRWGQPSYLTEKTKSGSLIRLDQIKKQPGKFAIYFHCQTDIIPRFRTLYPEMNFMGNRAIIFDIKDRLPFKKIEQCILYALTYNLEKSKLPKRGKYRVSRK